VLCVNHLEDRRANPDRVTEPENLAAMHALAVDEGPVRRPEVLDGQLAACVAGNQRVRSRNLRIVAEPAVAADLAADDQLVA
jgi:hypothetical protein